MSLLSREELKRLASESSGACASIYLPTHRTGAATQQDPIRFKNLLREAQSQLEALELDRSGVDKMLDPVWRLLDDDAFWRHQSDGLAVFVSAAGMRTFRLPVTFHELALVEDRFHLKPLLQLLTGDGRFHLLAISQKSVRLFEATRHTMREIDLGDIPASLQDAVGYDWEERSLQFHTGPAHRGAGGRVAIFHGQGAGADDERDEILTFFRRVDDGLLRLLEDREAPLVVAAVDRLIPMYRDASKHPNVLGEGVEGNPDQLRPDELHDRAWLLVSPHFQAARRAAADRYHELAGTGLASGNLAEVVPAACDGRVDTLLVAVGERCWGRYDDGTRHVEWRDAREPGDEDLLDLTAVQTLVKGGTVYAVPPAEVPGNGVVAALFRY